MKEGGLQKKKGCLSVILVIVCLLYFKIVSSISLSFSDILVKVKTGDMLGIGYLWIIVFFGLLCAFTLWRIIPKRFRIRTNHRPAKVDSPNAITLQTGSGALILGNPFRGIFILGAAGSGKSESIAVPLLSEFIRKGYAGIVYDFKYPALANDIQAFINANGSVLRHFCIDFGNPLSSVQINPINHRYLPNTSYAREYSQAIINNLLKESIKKPDFWSRSATDLLTACIWYLRDERPDICDLPHVFAMVTSKGEALLKTLQKNPLTAQMTISILDAMERGSDNQTSGVIGTLQGAIAQINTPELMYIFSGNDFSLEVNEPNNPAVVTVGTCPGISQTLAPLCSLIITVVTKLMNQPDKTRSFVLLDELPTVFIPNIEVLPNTGRSNKISTVLMCQDIAQLTDGYGKEKADVLFASCNTHFYGRVASSLTAELLCKQFGKEDKTFVTSSENRKSISPFKTHGESETVQERDIYRPSVFLNLQQGEFIGMAVESNYNHFRKQFSMVSRQPARIVPAYTANMEDLKANAKRVREDINKLLELPVV